MFQDLYHLLNWSGICDKILEIGESKATFVFRVLILHEVVQNVPEIVYFVA